ncbi:hypothetical protein C1O30_08620 [Dickeya zeae]|nr:hypothetical protein C1O30_08620 [Dickeya zeae]
MIRFHLFSLWYIAILNMTKSIIPSNDIVVSGNYIKKNSFHSIGRDIVFDLVLLKMVFGQLGGMK